MKTAWLNLHGLPAPLRARVSPEQSQLDLGQGLVDVDQLRWEIPTHGTVYGTALNFKDVLEGLGAALQAPPYQAPPRAPILYIKPRNTRIGYGVPVPLPPGEAAVAVGGTLGLVFGRSVRNATAGDALQSLAGYTVVNDVHLPHTSFYRPALKQQCRDGFCPMGPWIVERDQVDDPDALRIRIFINAVLQLETNTAALVRSIPRLIADVSAFMALAAGDVLLIGLPAQLPLARAGDRMAVEIEGVGRLENTLVPA